MKRGAKVRIARALGVALTPKAARIMERRPNPPGQHGATMRPKVSDYKKQLLEKQRLRAQYNISERQLQNAFTEATRQSGNTGVNLVRLLEMRLDAVVMRAGFARTIYAARQAVVSETLLPLSAVAEQTAGRAAAPRQAVEYEFLPGAGNILEEILPVSFKVRLFKCFLDAAVSEQIARRVAMKAATDNADDIIKQLSQEYNRARQSKITTELSEIIGGVEALK